VGNTSCKPGTVRGTARRPHFSLAIISMTVQLWIEVFLVISVYFNLRNILPKSGTFSLGHPVYFYNLNYDVSWYVGANSLEECTVSVLSCNTLHQRVATCTDLLQVSNQFIRLEACFTAPNTHIISKNKIQQLLQYTVNHSSKYNW